jgi:hypothetical protein
MLTFDEMSRWPAPGQALARPGRDIAVVTTAAPGEHRIDGVRGVVDDRPGWPRCGARKAGNQAYEDMINQGRTAFLSAPLDGMLEGGVPIIVDGHVIGAVGVSGVKSSEDVLIARAGIAALAS